MSLTAKRLQEVFRRAEVLTFDANSKFIIMSDCHRGQGNTGDNFLPNQTICFGALEYYFDRGFTYIELGDGDELWENRGMEFIIGTHSDVFWMLSRFYAQGRLHMLYGNHDMVKSRPSFLRQHCRRFYCETSSQWQPLFPDLPVREGLILENTSVDQQILLVHGHQGDLLNDALWPLARFLVRYVWGPLELIGLTAPIGAGRTHRQRDRIERGLAEYAMSRQQILIAGHTHRPVFSAPGTGYYFNDGSCVHPRCITGIEIEHNAIALVKWAIATRRDMGLCVSREVLEGPVPLAEYVVHTGPSTARRAG